MSNVAIIGGGGREYELGRAVGLSDRVEQIIFVDGNSGTENLPKSRNSNNLPDIKDTLFIIGPEKPLAEGLSDELRSRGGLVFGPSKNAAQLETSKAFATRFMQECNIPLPDSDIVHDEAMAEDIVNSRQPKDYVIKADGLAGGKGVILPKTHKEALDTVKQMMSGKIFDGAGETLIFQERLHGPEVSVFVLSDGNDFKILPIAQDHKRLLDGDEGPNTGGMGAYAPVPEHIVNADQYTKIHDIARQTIEGMDSKGTPFEGVLFMGIMLADEKGGDPIVIEYNVRFGDPEAQVVLPLIQENAYELILATAEHRLSEIELPKSIGKHALTVYLASLGYPDTPETGKIIHGLRDFNGIWNEYENVIVQHKSTSYSHSGRRIVTTGGRVLSVTGVGETIDQAADSAYAAIGCENGGIMFEGIQYRHDIGHQARTSK